MALLTINYLQAYYDEVRALQGIDLSIKDAEIATLIGANGAGKTTLFNSIMQMVDTTGEIIFDGNAIQNKKTPGIAQLGIAYVIEGCGTFTTLSVEENLYVGAMVRKDGRKAIKQDIEKMYQVFPILRKLRKQSAGLLSGGEQQMLAIARALMLRPKLILLDEPSTGLAPKIIEDIFNILKKINQEENLTILLAEQNVTLALDLADRVYLLETGQIIQSGTSDEMRDNPTVREAYIG